MNALATRWGSLQIGPRSARPNRRVDVYIALVVTAIACAAYLAALSVDVLPPSGLAVTFFSAAPVCAAVALPIIAVRARADADSMLSWFAAGLAVGLAALILQLVSYPLVSPAGGVFHTSGDGSAALYLLFHIGPAAGAIAGSIGVSAAWRRPSMIAGLALAVLFAVDAIPLPTMLRPDATFTPLLIGLTYATAALVGVAAVLWVLRAGRSAPALRGWVGVALSLLVYEPLLNALGGERFDAVWWASLSLRVAAFVVLAGGSIGSLLMTLRDQESYTKAELDRREGELRYSFSITSQLLSCADDLAKAVTPAEVGEVLCSDAMEATGMTHAVIALLSADGRELNLLASIGYDDAMRAQVQRFEYDEPLPLPHALRTGRALFLSSPEDIKTEFPATVNWPLRAAGSMAALPFKVGKDSTGVLQVWGEESEPLLPLQVDVLTGLVAQGGQAIARARAYENERSAAFTLQASLLPPRLPARRDLALAARYVPGEQGLQVGGDWYDCIELDDGRVALVVGDVMGKGLRAAALMGQIRTAVRALAVVDPGPASVLNALDRLAIGLGPDEIATVVYVLLDPQGKTARVARAGHLPPLLLSPSGAASFVEGGASPPLGAPAGERHDVKMPVPAGSLWLLYTDGAIEDRQNGLDRLQDLVGQAERLGAEHRGDIDALATAMIDEITASDRPDDVALLLAEHTDLSNHLT